MSKAIADMEHTLGLRLLDRSRNGVEPTAYGRALVKRGLTIFDELKQGVEELEFLADPSVGSLRIGSTESIAAGMFPVIIERFCREHPGVRLDVAQAVISTLHYRDLRERNIDLLIGRIPTPFAEDDLAADIVYDDQVVVVAGRQSKWARSRKAQARRSRGEPWILPSADTMPGSLAAELFVPAAQRCRVRLSRRFRFICAAGWLQVDGSSRRCRSRSCVPATATCLSRFCRSKCRRNRVRSGL